uniref:DHC_N2 domain-containing protein n=1 Tax=Rhabditophanes sp. KR3021 TaxID=114890 RepID=A0AC35UCA4_9BILA
MKSRRTREIYIPLIGSSQSYALNVIGTKINHLRQPFSTPEKDRKNKQKYILGLLSDELEDVDINTQFCLTRERDEIEFPSWPNQLRGIESRAEQMCFVKNEKIVGELLEELYQLWPKWNLRTRIIIDKRQNLNQVTIDKVVAFDKIPIWRKDDFLAKIKNALIGKLRLHSLIRDDFYTNVRKDLLFDWIGFFRDKKNRRCHRSLGELIEHVDQFIAQCTRITRFHWPLNICHLLLQNTSEWIHWIGEDSDLNIIKFFDSIASLQTQLLLRVVNQNYNNFFECQKEIFDHVNDTSIQQLDPDNDDQNGLSVYNIVKQISVISNEIPRCETKLFPDIFKNAGYLNCGNSTELPLFKIEYVNIFKTLEEDFEKLYYDIDQFLMEPMNCDKWKMLCIRLRDYEKLLKLKTTKSFTNTFMFNFSNHKETLLGKCSDMVRLLRRNMDEFLSVRMKDIVTFYASSSAKLYGQNEINQICSIAQVKEKDLPRLKIKVNEVKVCFKVAQDLDLITETIVLKFHNVNQLPTKLFQLIELIQSILKVDQEDIEKEILMQAKEMYEDVTNLEREVHFTKRKYISSKYPNELAKVAARLEIAENKLLEIVDVFPLLQQRMDIFGLEPLDFDIYSLYKRAKVYGIFAKAHGPILEFYERTMNNHVMALNYLAFDEKLFIFKNKVEELRKEKEKHTESYILNVIDIAFGKMEGEFFKIIKID